MSRYHRLVITGIAGVGALALAAPTPALARPANSQTPLQSAQQLLAQSRAELVEAREALQLIRHQSAAGMFDAPTVAALNQTVPSPAFDSGASDIEMIANLLGPTEPDVALHTATVEELAVIEPASAEPDATPLVVTSPKRAIAAAQARIFELIEQQDAANQLLRQLRTSSTSADGPGAQKLARLCSDAGVLIEQCRAVSWPEAHLQFDTVMIGRTVNARWSQVREVGGYRPSDPYPDHPSGRAADIMMPNGGSGSDVKLGNEIAKYFQAHAKEYGIYYMLWRQQMWKAGDPVGAWTSVSDRGDPTSNHMDHVHITVSTGHDGTAWKELMAAARKDARS